jgi:hypothetical protein
MPNVPRVAFGGVDVAATEKGSRAATEAASKNDDRMD